MSTRRSIQRAQRVRNWFGAALALSHGAARILQTWTLFIGIENIEQTTHVPAEWQGNHQWLPPPQRLRSGWLAGTITGSSLVNMEISPRRLPYQQQVHISRWRDIHQLGPARICRCAVRYWNSRRLIPRLGTGVETPVLKSTHYVYHACNFCNRGSCHVAHLADVRLEIILWNFYWI